MPIYSSGPSNSNPATATTSAVGAVKPSDGLAVDAGGALTVKIGAGLKLDASKNVLADEPNINVLNLQNASMLSTGIPKGAFDSSATLATFSNGVLGNWWVYGGSGSFSLGGQTFAVGDQLWVKTAFGGAPANLTTNFVKVADTVGQATTTVFGTVKLGSVTPSALGTAAIGTSLAAAREDHAHALPAALAGATAGVAGTAGLVPAPAAGAQAKFLQGDGTWAVPPSAAAMVGSTMGAVGVAGLVPAAPANEFESVLCSDGNWRRDLRVASITVDDTADPVDARFGVTSDGTYPQIRYLSGSNIYVNRVTSGVVELPNTQSSVLGFMSDGRVEIYKLTLPNHPFGRSVLGSDLDLSVPASGVWTSTGLTISLPAAGTYMVEMSVRSTILYSSSAYILARLYDATAGAAIANSELLCTYTAGSTATIKGTFTTTVPITVTGATTIRLDANRNGTVTNAQIESSSSGRTALTWWKIA